LYAQLSTCGDNTINNVSRLVNVKIINNALLLAEAAPAGMPSGRVLRRDLTNNMTSTLIGGLDFPLGMDIHPTNGNLYVGERGFANANNNRIRVFNGVSNAQITSIPRLTTTETMDVFSIDATGRLFVLVNNMSGNTLVNTSIRVYNTNNNHQVINLTGIPLTTPTNQRFLDLDTFTEIVQELLFWQSPILLRVEYISTA
jgi:sugar lactone lactonase YvrE